MMPFFIIVSMIGHCISILAIAVLYARQNRYSDVERRVKKLQQETEGIMQAYLLEMKEENERILSVLSLDGTDGIGRPKQATAYDEVEHVHADYTPPFEEVVDSLEWTDLRDDMEPSNTTDRTLKERAVRMHRSGMEIGEIAKALSKGKTEVELMIKFQIGS
ncbi:MAG: hypothetical protein ACI4XL_03430 [Bacillus sp. (in: firmicutes)]